MKKALITGITGQDGSYLADFLLSKGYEVHGIVRRASTFNTSRVDHIIEAARQSNNPFFFHYGDLLDTASLLALVQKIQPDEIYNLAAQSHVRVSFDMPEYTSNVDGLGTLRLLEAIRLLGLTGKAKLYQASTSELFGKAHEVPQSETTPFYPRSPYGVAKLYGFWMIKNYREAYNMFACNGILFNHESPRRGETFVTRKITRAVARIKAGLDKKIYLGNIDARRDWGFAPEYVETMWKMLQQEVPDDYVIATGEQHSVRDFLAEAFSYAGLGDWQPYIEFERRYLRPTEVEALVGDSTKAKNKIGWQPKIAFPDLVRIMLDSEFKKIGLEPPGEGEQILRERFPDRWWSVD